jgi:hypothetical protein
MINKKAQEAISNYPFWMVFVVAVGITIIIIVSIGNYYLGQAAEIPKDVEELTLIQIFHSKGCFAYEDEVGRVHTNTIDLDKFTQENIEICFPGSDVKYSFSLSLEIPEIGLNTGQITTSNWVESADSSEKIENVRVIQDGNEYSGKPGDPSTIPKLRIRIKNV